MDLSKKYLRSLKRHDLQETASFLQRIHDGTLPAPLQLYRYNFKNARRSFKKQAREKLDGFIPHLEEHFIRPLDFFIM